MSVGCGACGAQWKQPREMLPAVSKVSPGMYMLGAYSTCTQFYRGPHEGEGVFVVAPASPDERMFRWADYETAVTYAEGLGLTQIDKVPVSSLCQQAVDDLYAGA